MSYTSDTLQCILNIKQIQINVLVIQCQTHLGKIFKCTIFEGYGGVINFERCRTTSPNDNGGEQGLVTVFNCFIMRQE